MFVDFNILNQLGSPSINSNTFANRPAAGQTGRLFVSTDTFEIFRDNGTGWDLIGGPGAGTITGTGTATQVAYFTGAQTIGSSANLFWDNTNTRLGIGTSTPGVRLDVHGTGNMLHLNATAATANTLMSFQRLGSNVWRLGDQYSGGFGYFEVHNGVINNNAVEFQTSTNKATFGAIETYSSGGATGSLFSYTLTVPNGTNFTGPNAIGSVNSALTLNLGGNTTVPNSTRQGLEGNSRINFTGPGTLTVTQGSATIRAFSALSSVYSFAGSSAGTITHLAGLRVCFPDNIGLGAISITNNYAILINDQTTGLGTVTYTNRWGIYQEGASDLNYFNGNLLIKSTTNTGEALQVTGTAKVTSTLTANSLVKSGGTASQILAADGSVITAGTNITIASGQISSTGGGGITGSGSAGQVTFWTGASAVSGTNNFFWDNANNRLGILTITPADRLDVNGNIRVSGGNFLNLYNATNDGFGSWYNSGGSGVNQLVARVNAGDRMIINGAGNIGVATNTPGSRLQINGNCAIGYSASTAAPTNGLQVAGATNLNGTVTIADTINLVFATSTGTKIGTATSQKLAFWNATPIVQPTTAVASAARVGGGGTTVTDTDTFGGYTIAQVVQALRNTGILA